MCWDRYYSNFHHELCPEMPHFDKSGLPQNKYLTMRRKSLPLRWHEHMVHYPSIRALKNVAFWQKRPTWEWRPGHTQAVLDLMVTELQSFLQYISRNVTVWSWRLTLEWRPGHAQAVLALMLTELEFSSTCFQKCRVLAKAAYPRMKTRSCADCPCFTTAELLGWVLLKMSPDLSHFNKSGWLQNENQTVHRVSLPNDDNRRGKFSSTRLRIFYVVTKTAYLRIKTSPCAGCPCFMMTEP